MYSLRLMFIFSNAARDIPPHVYTFVLQEQKLVCTRLAAQGKKYGKCLALMLHAK